MSAAVQSAVAMARRLLHSGKPAAVAIRQAADEYGVHTVDVATGLRGPRKSVRRPVHRHLPDRCTHVPDKAYWVD